MLLIQRNSTILDNNIPFCINNLLKERDHKYLNIARTFRNTSLQIYRRQSQCQIQKYTVERTVACLDILNEEQHSNKTKELHFVFMGDSRIRQQFFNFLRVSQHISLFYIRHVCLILCFMSSCF